MTNMTIFKSSEYSCLRICNFDDAKVIVIDRICTCSKLIFNLNQINTALRREIKKHTAQRQEIKTNRVVQRRRNQKANKRKQKICKITYSIKIEGKTTRMGDFWVKIDPKSPI